MRTGPAWESAVYGKAHGLAISRVALSERILSAGRVALTTRIRCSSRSICLNLREARAKRRYPGACLSKLTEGGGANGEIGPALECAADCGRLARDDYVALTMLGAMIQQAGEFPAISEP